MKFFFHNKSQPNNKLKTNKPPYSVLPLHRYVIYSWQALHDSCYLDLCHLTICAQSERWFDSAVGKHSTGNAYLTWILLTKLNLVSHSLDKLLLLCTFFILQAECFVLNQEINTAILIKKPQQTQTTRNTTLSAPLRLPVKHRSFPQATQAMQETVLTKFRLLISYSEAAFHQNLLNVALVWALVFITDLPVPWYQCEHGHSVLRPLKATWQYVFGDYPRNIWGKQDNWLAKTTASFSSRYLKSLIASIFNHSERKARYVI